MANRILPLLGVLLASTACARSETVERASAAGEGHTLAAAPAQYRLRGWQPRQEYDYRVHTSSLITLAGKSPLYDFDLKANARVLALDVAGDRGSFYLSLENVEFTSRIPGTQADFDALKGQLAQPYFFELKGGLVSSAQVPQDLHPLATAVFRSLSAALQFAGVDGPSRTFTVNEFDTTGQYLAEYAPGNEPLSWHKRKQRYLGILLGDTDSKDAREVAPKVVASEGSIGLSAEGRPLRIDLRDELELASAQAPLRSKTIISLVAASSRPASKSPGDLQALRKRLVTVAANAPFESAADRKSLDEAKIDGATFDQVLAKLEQLQQTPRPSQQDQSLDAKRAELKKQADAEGKVFIAMGALLRAQPETVARATDKIRGNSVASEALLDALGSAGSPEAQKALVAFIVDGKTEKLVRGRAMLSLSRTENPTDEAVQTLLAAIGDEQLGTQALYGIGNYTRAFTQTGNPAGAETLGGVLLQRLAAAKSEKALIEALRAIANSGFSPAFDKVKSYLNDQREQVRVDAVAALALMPGAAVEAILVERLALDGAKKVRLAALDAIGSRAPSDVLVSGLRRNITTADPHVRYRGLEIMIRWLPKRSELREPVQQLAQNDSEQQIRELAKAAL